MPHLELVLALVLVVAMLCQWLAWRVKLPAILFLLLSGLIAGPVSGWVDPDAMLGDLLMPMVSMSVAIILFEGSLTLNLKEIQGVDRVVRRMITVGALVTWIVVAIATHMIFSFSWQVSALFGAIVIVTGPTVIVPMLRAVRPTSKIANILRWEGIAIDPVGALMAVITFEFILASVNNLPASHVLLLFLEAVAAGTAIGVAAGIILGLLLSKNLIPEYLQNIATLSLVLIAFSGSNAVVHESGLIAVTVMGMWLANKSDLDIHPILNFKEHLSLLLISMLFILLAARIDLQQLADIFWPALTLLLVLQFVARPLKILVSTWGLDVSWPERGLLAWIAPRGIVAAAISAIFADRLLAAGFEEAALLVPMTFFMIIGTVVLQSSTSRLLARWLGVAEPTPRGFLMVGANAFSRALAKEFQRHDLPCLLVDSNWNDIRQARMDGLDTFYGNPVSDHAETYLDLSGMGSLLAISRQQHLNAISAVHFRADFGSNRIYSLMSVRDMNSFDKHQFADSYQGHKLFAEDISYYDLATKMNKGAEIKSTNITEEYSWEMYQSDYAGKRIPLFIINSKGKAMPVLVGNETQPEPGSTVLALAEADAQEAVKKQEKQLEKKKKKQSKKNGDGEQPNLPGLDTEPS